MECRNVECSVICRVRTESNGHFGENLERTTGFWNQQFINGLKEQFQKECAEQGQTTEVGKGDGRQGREPCSCVVKLRHLWLTSLSPNLPSLRNYWLCDSDELLKLSKTNSFLLYR